MTLTNNNENSRNQGGTLAEEQVEDDPPCPSTEHTWGHIWEPHLVCNDPEEHHSCGNSAKNQVWISKVPFFV